MRPGGRCTECDCCGDDYRAYDDNSVPVCVPNSENTHLIGGSLMAHPACQSACGLWE